MRRFAVVVAMAAAVVAIAPSGAFANAGAQNRTESEGTVSGVQETGWVGTSQGGANMQTTQFRSSYTDGLQGPVTCAGVNQRGKNISSPYGRDSFTCTSDVGHLAFTPYVGYHNGWFSDFWALQDQAVFGSFTITETDGSTYYTAIATY